MQSRWIEIERRCVQRMGRSLKDPWSVTRVLPLMLAGSVALWALASDATIRAVTPWVGTLALCVAGVYLSRVVLRISAFYYRHLEHFGELSAPRSRRLRQSLRRMLSVLVGIVVVALVYFALSVGILARSRMPDEPQLLWTLPVGGLVLSFVFGELVSRLLAAVDAVLSAVIASGARADEAERLGTEADTRSDREDGRHAPAGESVRP